MAEYIEHEKVLDDRNIITVQTKEYGSIEVIPVDTITDIELADVQPVNQWISVKDRQPQEGGFYLTYYAEHIHVSQWFPSKNWYNEHGGNVTNMVEYWQPLPEPPNE